MVHASGHVDIAAYLLGALDEPDNTAFEEHLLECPRCQLELVELQDVPDLLDTVKHEAPALLVPVPGPQVLSALLDEAGRTRHRRRRRQWAAAAAAVLLIIAAPLVTLAVTERDGADPVAVSPSGSSSNIQLDPRTEPSPSEDPTVLEGGSGAGGGMGGPMDATVTLQTTKWGTEIDMELRGAIGPRRCQLYAISRQSEARVVTGWSVPPGGSESIKITGSTPFSTADIERLEIRDDAGNILLSLPT